MISDKVVMIIDDDADDIIYFKEALKEISPSASTLEANSGIEALQLLRTVAKSPDFIFLDSNMPRMDGKECLTELKRDAKLKNIPVIMYSTSFNDKSIKELQALGASGYLYKPADTNQLPTQIIEVINQHLKSA